MEGQKHERRPLGGGHVLLCSPVCLRKLVTSKYNLPSNKNSDNKLLINTGKPVAKNHGLVCNLERAMGKERGTETECKKTQDRETGELSRWPS